MKKSGKQIMAIVGIVILVCLYLSALIFSLIDSPLANTLLQASYLMTIAVPVLLYVFILLTKNAKNRKENRETGVVDQPEDEIQDKRRSRRLPINVSLNISDLYIQDKLVIPGLESPINVIDISKHGIGFNSECILPDGYYFDARIDLGSGKVIDTVVKIVRSEAVDKDLFHYGANFENIPEDISQDIDEYAKSLNM